MTFRTVETLLALWLLTGLGSIADVENAVVDVHSDLPDHRIKGAVAIAA